MTLLKAIRLLVALVLAIPLVQTLLGWVAGLLLTMGDEGAAHVVGRVGLGAGVAWLLSLTALVVCLGLKAAVEPQRIAVPLEECEEPLS